MQDRLSPQARLLVKLQSAQQHARTALLAYVVQVNLGEEGRQPYILLNVDWFATQRRHPHCRDVHLVKLSEGFYQDEAMVPPDLTDGQVFYAEDPEFPGELAVFLRRTSSYVMPMHLRAGVSAAAMRTALAQDAGLRRLARVQTRHLDPLTLALKALSNAVNSDAETLTYINPFSLFLNPTTGAMPRTVHQPSFLSMPNFTKTAKADPGLHRAFCTVFAPIFHWNVEKLPKRWSQLLGFSHDFRESPVAFAMHFS